MKTELEQKEIEAIANKVAEYLKTLIFCNHKESDKLFTVDELAAYLKVDQNWIYKRTRFNEIPYIKKGKY